MASASRRISYGDLTYLIKMSLYSAQYEFHCEYMHVSSRRLVLHFVPWFDCSPSEINDIYVLIVPRLKRLEKDSYLRRKTFWSRVYEMDLQYICPNLIVALDTNTLPDKAKTTANIELWNNIDKSNLNISLTSKKDTWTFNSRSEQLNKDWCGISTFHDKNVIAHESCRARRLVLMQTARAFLWLVLFF